MNTPGCDTSLALLGSVLTQESNASAAFVALLERETEVLAQGAQIDALNKITEEKDTLTTTLHALSAQRDSVLSTLEYAAGLPGLDKVQHDHPSLASTITTLLSQAQQAHSLNSRNGRLIEQLLQHNEEALETVEQLLHRTEGLYDAKGRNRRTGTPRATAIRAG